jgi:anti-sigma factor RsiW
MTNERDDQRTPDDIEALLPWHAVGRLRGDEARRVDEALARDAELARRFALVEEERGETVALNEALGAPSSRVRDRLFERIEAASPARSAPHGARAGGWLEAIVEAFSPRALALATAALAIVALVQAGVLTTLLVSDGAGERFTTASGPEAGRESGTFVLVALAPDATAAQIEAFLERSRAVIVDGPRPGGLFRLRVGDRRLSAEELERLLADLRAQPVVRLAVAGR